MYVIPENKEEATGKTPDGRKYKASRIGPKNNIVVRIVFLDSTYYVDKAYILSASTTEDDLDEIEIPYYDEEDKIITSRVVQVNRLSNIKAEIIRENGMDYIHLRFQDGIVSKEREPIKQKDRPLTMRRLRALYERIHPIKRDNYALLLPNKT